MSRGYLDPSTLTRAEKFIAASAWVGVANAWVPWWYRVVTTDGTVIRFNAGVDWTGIVAWACFGAAGLLVLVKAWIWPMPAPRRDGTLYLVFATVALSALSVQSVTHNSASIGFGIAVVLAIVLGAAGVMRRRERHSGWR